VDAVSTPAWAALADRFAKTPGAKLIVVVVHPYVAPPSLDQRDAMGAVQLALTKAGVTAGLVILGAGFGASLKLGFATALTLFSKATRPMIVVSDLESLAAKLPSSLASVRGTLLELGAAVEKPPRRTYGAA
jgi:hypothetical protein